MTRGQISWHGNMLPQGLTVWYMHAVSFIIFFDEELILKSWEIGCFWAEEWTSLWFWLQPAITPFRTWKDFSFSQVSNFKGHFWINENRGKFWKLLITCNGMGSQPKRFTCPWAFQIQALRLSLSDARFMENPAAAWGPTRSAARAAVSYTHLTLPTKRIV